MSGNHHHDRSDHHHDHGHHHGHGSGIGHHPAGPIFRPLPMLRAGRRRTTRSRRAFLGDLGRGTLAMAVITPLAVACGSSSDGADATTTGGDAGSDVDVDADGTTGDETEATTAGADDAETGTETQSVRWARANLGFVSAYVLARGNTAAIVDTGVSGSADAIGESLGSLGLNYDDVDHVILTHNHGDHAGSIAEVVERAVGATIYAGQDDLDEIQAEAIVGLTGGEDVFGFEMLATPGHTAGHMAAIDHGAGLLVAGDAIFTEDGGVVEGPARFFDDVEESRDSIRLLAELSFNTLLVGHGEPIEQAADTAVAALAASLP